MIYTLFNTNKCSHTTVILPVKISVSKIIFKIIEFFLEKGQIFHNSRMQLYKDKFVTIKNLTKIKII